MTTEFYFEHLKQIESTLNFLINSDSVMSHNSRNILQKESNKIKRILNASDFRHIVRNLK